MIVFTIEGDGAVMEARLSICSPITVINNEETFISRFSRNSEAEASNF